jgi:hypothetical protein
VKHFYNSRNAILYIQDIEIINAFRDGVSDIKTVEEITMKKPQMVANLLAAADVCIEASEARARLLKSHGKGPQRRSRMIRKSRQLTGEIVKIMETVNITGITNNSLRIRNKRGIFVALAM